MNNYKVTLDEINKEVKINRNGGEYIFNYDLIKILYLVQLIVLSEFFLNIHSRILI